MRRSHCKAIIIRQLAGLLAMASCSVFSAPTLAGFTAPFVISRSGETPGFSSAVLDAQGRGYVVWSASEKPIQGRPVSPTGEAGPIEVLSPRPEPAFSPTARIDATGRIQVFWSAGNPARVATRKRFLTGRLSAIQTISSPGNHASISGVAMDRSGNAIIAWNRLDDGFNFHREARSRSANGVLGPVKVLTASTFGALYAAPALSPNGNGVIVWQVANGSSGAIVRALPRTAVGNFGATTTVSATSEEGYFPQVAIDADGDALISWESFVGSVARARARSLSKSGQYGPIFNLTEAGELVSGTDVAVTPDGRGLFVWSLADETFTSRIRARSRSAAGTLGVVRNLSGQGQNCIHPQVALAPNGKAIVVWQRTFTVSGEQRHQIQAVAGSLDSGFGPVQSLSGLNEDAVLNDVAFNANGQALVVWTSYISDEVIRIRGAVGP